MEGEKGDIWKEGRDLSDCIFLYSSSQSPCVGTEEQASWGIAKSLAENQEFVSFEIKQRTKLRKTSELGKNEQF